MKRFFLFVLYLFGSSSIFSQSPVWKIEGKGTTIYVGGSIHILREQDYPLPKEFEKAYNNSEVLVLEVDIDPKGSMESISKLIGLTLYPSNKSLKTVLRKEVYEKLDSAFITNGLVLENMIGYKPVMAVLTLSMAELRKIGMNTKGVDKYFYEKATESGRNLLFLESADFQMNLLTQLGEDNENEYVLHSLEESRYYREFDSLIEKWRKGNNTELIELIDAYKRDHSTLYQSLLLERNNNWMPHLESYLETPEIEFIIVGAMHLYGQDGILQQMKNRGYQVNHL